MRLIYFSESSERLYVERATSHQRGPGNQGKYKVKFSTDWPHPRQDCFTWQPWPLPRHTTLWWFVKVLSSSSTPRANISVFSSEWKAILHSSLSWGVRGGRPRSRKDTVMTASEHGNDRCKNKISNARRCLCGDIASLMLMKLLIDGPAQTSQLRSSSWGWDSFTLIYISICRIWDRIP